LPLVRTSISVVMPGQTGPEEEYNQEKRAARTGRYSWNMFPGILKKNKTE